MKEEMFNELLQSVREGGAILRGEKAPARSFVIEDPDVSAIRKNFKLSQPKFAAFLGISTRTLQNWEQRRRKPEGPARVLLQVAARHPEAVLDVVAETRVSRQTTTTRLRHARTVKTDAKKASRGSFEVAGRKKAVKKTGTKRTTAKR